MKRPALPMTYEAFCAWSRHCSMTERADHNQRYLRELRAVLPWGVADALWRAGYSRAEEVRTSTDADLLAAGLLPEHLPLVRAHFPRREPCPLCAGCGWVEPMDVPAEAAS